MVRPHLLGFQELSPHRPREIQYKWASTRFAVVSPLNSSVSGALPKFPRCWPLRSSLGPLRNAPHHRILAATHIFDLKSSKYRKANTLRAKFVSADAAEILEELAVAIFIRNVPNHHILAASQTSETPQSENFREADRCDL